MVIGITGGIGSGKSTVSRVFEILGCAVFNSDEAAKAVYFEPTYKKQIIALLGEDVYTASGIDKKRISEKIFSNQALLQQLNAIIHPAVGNYFKYFCEQTKAKILIKESALLFEAGLHTSCDKIIVVAADDELRIQRVMKRDQLNREQVLSKMNQQWPQNEKIKQADYVIYNDERRLLLPQVLSIYQQLHSQTVD